jgi:hypothetical protein
MPRGPAAVKSLHDLHAPVAHACRSKTAFDAGRSPVKVVVVKNDTLGQIKWEQPPLPAKVTLDQPAKFATSLIRGGPNREKIALTVLGDRVRELV